MTITLRCTGCAAELKVEAAHAGKQVRCARCKTVLTVPADTQDEPILFRVWELETQNDLVTKLAIDFLQRCEENGPPHYGMLRFNSTYE